MTRKNPARSLAATRERRRELHALDTNALRRLYAKKSGRLISEVRVMFQRLPDDGRQVMIDSIIVRESRP